MYIYIYIYIYLYLYIYRSEEVSVTATVIEHAKGEKVQVFKKKRRKGYAKRIGNVAFLGTDCACYFNKTKDFFSNVSWPKLFRY